MAPLLRNRDLLVFTGAEERGFTDGGEEALQNRDLAVFAGEKRKRRECFYFTEVPLRDEGYAGGDAAHQMQD